jgi:cysteine desulfurase
VDLYRLYLDYNATSPLSESVLNWLKSGDFLFANSASQHSVGKASRKMINESRSQIYETFKRSDKETHLFFHSGATEGMMSFAYSFSEWARITGKELLICYSKIDHPAVTMLCERYFGAHVKFLELQMTQNLAYDHVNNLKVIQDKKDNNPELLILYHHLWVHNETGIVSPLEELIPFKKIADLYVHVDAVQAPGKIPEWNKLSHGDIFTFSAHKFGALKGIGFSFLSSKISYSPLISGGAQQGGLRSGTENIQGVKSLSLALKDLELVNVKETIEKRTSLESFLEEELNGIGGVISKLSTSRNSNTIYFYLNDLSSDIALALFDVNGLMISAGSACSSGAAKASVIMNHLGYKTEAKNGLRISLAFNLSLKELEEIKSRLKITFEKLKP